MGAAPTAAFPQKPKTGRPAADHRRIINGILMAFVLSPGQRREALGFEPVMAGGAVKRRGRGRPKQRPGRGVGDKAYSSRKIRDYLRRHGICITRLKQNRRVARIMRNVLKIIAQCGCSQPLSYGCSMRICKHALALDSRPFKDAS